MTDIQKDVNQEPIYIGTAKMEENGDIVLNLVARTDKGGVGHAQVRYKPGTTDYEETLQHINGLKPGESKPVPPWDN